jgi:hypothetical protein
MPMTGDSLARFGCGNLKFVQRQGGLGWRIALSAKIGANRHLISVESGR